MEPITTGMQGAAVEDVQSRLLQLGYTIDDTEVADKRFGTTTEQAVSTFRLDSGLAAGHAVDIPCWSALVDASYKLGDRTLYLRMPNFHGADVQALQRALNVLGFACGEDDGYFGPHTDWEYDAELDAYIPSAIKEYPLTNYWEVQRHG